jgi:sn-glycerol 3-phosphate transport system substrate-binding protein
VLVPRVAGVTWRRCHPLFLFSLGMTLLLAAGCGGSSTTNGASERADLPECPLEALEQAPAPVEVVVWHSLQAKQNETVNELAAQFNASQSQVRVRMENVAASDEELLRKFISAVPSRQLPAVVVANDTMTVAMADSGVILPAQSCVDADGYDLSPLAETVRAYYTIDDVLWAASANPGSALIFYNRDHFRRAGLDADDPPSNLTEIRAAAEAIKDAGVVDRPFVHEVASFKTEFWLTGAHAPIVDNNNGRSSPPTGGALEGDASTSELFDWFDAMHRDGLMQPIPVAEGQINQYLAMANQQASMAVESSSASTSVEAFLVGDLDEPRIDVEATTELSGLDVGAGAFPGIREPGRTQMGGPAWFITSTGPSEVQAGAWQFMRFMNDEPAQVRMLTGGSFLPYRTSASETPEAQQFFESSLAGGWLRLANEQVDTIDPDFPGPLIGPYDDVRLALRDAMTSMLFEGVSSAEAIASAQRRIDEVVQAYAEGGF